MIFLYTFQLCTMMSQYLNCCSFDQIYVVLIFSISQLKILQKRVVRLCAGAHYRAHTCHLFQQLELLPLAKLIDVKTGTFMYEFQNNLLPDIFFDYYTTHNQIHSQKTRNRFNYRFPIFRSALSEAISIQFHGVKTWNKLPTYLKESTSLVQFKKRYKMFISTVDLNH